MSAVSFIVLVLFAIQPACYSQDATTRQLPQCFRLEVLHSCANRCETSGSNRNLTSRSVEQNHNSSGQATGRVKRESNLNLKKIPSGHLNLHHHQSSSGGQETKFSKESSGKVRERRGASVKRSFSPLPWVAYPHSGWVPQNYPRLVSTLSPRKEVLVFSESNATSLTRYAHSFSQTLTSRRKPIRSARDVEAFPAFGSRLDVFSDLPGGRSVQQFSPFLNGVHKEKSTIKNPNFLQKFTFPPLFRRSRKEANPGHPPSNLSYPFPASNYETSAVRPIFYPGSKVNPTPPAPPNESPYSVPPMPYPTHAQSAYPAPPIPHPVPALPAPLEITGTVPTTSTPTSQGTIAKSRMSLTPTEMTAFQCYCDVMCPLYGDCCADYFQLCLSVDVTRRTQMMQVEANARTAPGLSMRQSGLLSRMGCGQLVPQSPYYRLIDRCDDVQMGRNYDSNRRQCEGPTFHENISSIPLALLPDRKFVFKNVFCAFCNGIFPFELDNNIVYLKCLHAGFTTQHDIQLALNNGTCQLVANSTLTSLLRQCPAPSLLQPGCSGRPIGRDQDHHQEHSHPDRTLPANSSNATGCHESSSMCGLPEAACECPQEKVKEIMTQDQFPSSSGHLCGAYRHYVFLNNDKKLKLFANPDCLACSRDVARPQILHVDDICEGSSTPSTTPLNSRFPSSAIAPQLASFQPNTQSINQQNIGISEGNILAAGNPATTNTRDSGATSSFKVYFQLTDDAWGYQVNGRIISPQLFTCPDDQVYVPYYSRCETINCPRHTYAYRGRCQIKERYLADPALQLFPNGNSHFSFTISFTPRWLTDQGHITQAAKELKAAYQAFLEESSVRGTKSLKSNITLAKLVIKSTKSKESRPTQESLLVSLRMDIVDHNISVQEIVDESLALSNASSELYEADPFELESVVVSNFVNNSGDWECFNGSTKYSRYQTLLIDDDGEYFLQTPRTFFNLENIGFELQTFPVSNSSPVLLRAVVCELPPLLACLEKGFIYLNASFFTIVNDSLVVSLNGDTFSNSSYALFDNGSAAVCSVYNSTYVQNVYVFAMMKGYVLEETVSIATLSTSLVSLVVVLMTYSLLPQLRNVPGVIVMSYAGSLLVSQALTLLAEFPRDWLCVIHSCLTHASMLSSFFWKSALSFDLVFMLRLKSVENSSRASRARMLNFYSCVGWLFPVVFVLVFWVLDVVGVFEVHYGSRASGVCWMESRWGNLYLVMIPLGLTWFFNVVCFTLALCLIYQRGGLRASALRSKNQLSGDWRRLMIYFRISLLMGSTWLLCFLAASLDVEALWMAHIILNGYQGVYLLLCFVIKRRVWTMIKERLRGVKGQVSRDRHGDEVTTSMTTLSLTVSKSPAA